MKKTLLPILALSAIFSTGAMAADIDGFVVVNSTLTQIYGQLNVGSSPAAGHANSYIWANGYANGSVGFGGRDAVNSRTFYCTVPVGSALYDAAVDIRNKVGPDTYLRVNKNTSDSQCNRIFILKDSRRHD